MTEKTANYKLNGFGGLTENVLAGQSILDVFVLQDILDLEDAERLKLNLETNREIENFLVKHRVVTRETINKAYSILLKLPYVALQNVQISDEALALIPEKLASRYGIIPFNVSDRLIRIAIARPADLLARFPEHLTQFFEENGYGIELFITGEGDFQEALQQYDKSKKDSLLLKQGSLPVVYLRNQIIADKYLKKLPREFIFQYRLVVFGENRADEYLIACENPDSALTRRIIEFLRRENGIEAELFATSKKDIDFVLSYYDKSSVQRPKPEIVGDEEKQTQVEKTTDKQTRKNIIKSILNSFLRRPEGPEITIDERPDFSKFMAKTPVSAAANTSATKNIVVESTEEKKEEVQKAAAHKTEANDKKAVPDDTINKFTQHKKEEPAKSEKSKDNESSQEREENIDSDIGKLLEGVEVGDPQALDKIIKEGYVPKIVAAVIDYALHNRASDIHLEPGAKHFRIRCRVDGILQEIAKLRLDYHPPVISRIKILSRLKIDETRIPQDGRFGLVFKGREVDIRVSTLPTVHGEKVVLRVLDKEQSALSLEDLGMQGTALEATIKSIQKPYGIILSTGPTGSGKSTTLYAILNRVSLPGVNIITLEDPVEYEIPGINQCQVRPEIGFSFASGLRSVLRQDPNVIMVGEIRDAETAGMATHAALTGHLVLSTLHTNDTANTLPRLINMGVEAFLITSSINLVIAQRLVRRICPNCREEIKIPAKLLEQVQEDLKQISPKNQLDSARVPAEFKFYHGRGCTQCNQGYKGRVGLFEVMEITPEIEDLAASKRPADEIKTASLKGGMITMRQDGLLKCLAGATTLDEVFQATMNN